LGEVEALACKATSATARGSAVTAALQLLRGLQQRVANRCSSAAGTEAAERMELETYASLLQVLAAKGNDGFEEERSLLQRAKVEGGGRLEDPRARLRHLVLRRLHCDIPNVVHFVRSDTRGGEGAAVLTLLQFLAIRAAERHMQPDAIYFHSPVEPQGERWDRVKAAVEWVPATPPSRLGEMALEPAAHRSDVMRLEILLREGGIYMDSDVIPLRPFGPLLRQGKPCLLGEERRVPGYGYSLSNAVLLAQPRSAFLRQWLQEIPHVYQPGCYTCHSVAHAPRIAARMSRDVRVLPWQAFSNPGWEREGVDELYRERGGEIPGEEGERARRAEEGAYAIHLFQSHQNVKGHLAKLTEEYVQTADTAFNAIVRPLLAAG